MVFDSEYRSFGYFFTHIAISNQNLTGNTANISSAVGHTLKKDTKNSEIKIQVGHLDFYRKYSYDKMISQIGSMDVIKSVLVNSVIL